VARATDEATVSAYYAATPHYLYELSYWEASKEKQSWFDVLARACRANGLQRVLDFGGGVGGLTLALRSRGIACDHLDVPGKTTQYAGWRFARHGFPVSILDATSPEKLPSGYYDAVAAWDVLEHIFDLDAAIATIGRLLRPGGWFMSKSSFADAGSQHLHIHLAQHAPYADVQTLNGLMDRHGFNFRGQLKPNELSRLLRHCGVSYAVAGVKIAPRLKHGGNFLVHVKQGG
jgi:2-polyprenyl-3-methyl-5-hydroxy-6-metoxy-1,4-benzoquinol methylase